MQRGVGASTQFTNWCELIERVASSLPFSIYSVRYGDSVYWLNLLCKTNNMTSSQRIVIHFSSTNMGADTANWWYTRDEWLTNAISKSNRAFNYHLQCNKKKQNGRGFILIGWIYQENQRKPYSGHHVYQITNVFRTCFVRFKFVISSIHDARCERSIVAMEKSTFKS